MYFLSLSSMCPIPLHLPKLVTMLIFPVDSSRDFKYYTSKYKFTMQSLPFYTNESMLCILLCILPFFFHFIIHLGNLLIHKKCPHSLFTTTEYSIEWMYYHNELNQPLIGRHLFLFIYLLILVHRFSFFF